MMAECWWIYNEKQITAQTRMKSYGKKNIIVLLKIKTYTHTHHFGVHVIIGTCTAIIHYIGNIPT